MPDKIEVGQQYIGVSTADVFKVLTIQKWGVNTYIMTGVTQYRRNSTIMDTYVYTYEKSDLEAKIKAGSLRFLKLVADPSTVDPNYTVVAETKPVGLAEGTFSKSGKFYTTEQIQELLEWHEK